MIDGSWIETNRKNENRALFSNYSDEWETPQNFFDELNDEFHFTLDPCATDDNRKCDTWFTKETNGLTKDWGGAESILQSTVQRNCSMGRKELS